MDPLITLTEAEYRALTTERLLVWRDDAVFRIEGPGATDCLQGLLTNDVKTAGDRGLIWGAVLTPKGMIISDMWIRREGPTSAMVIVPAQARESLRTLFQRSLPPRLAKYADLTGEVTVGWFLGGTADALDGCDIAAPNGPAPFAAMALSRDAARDGGQAEGLGWRVVPPVYAEASKLLLGWPTLGREIDEKTLVQEVRFDELVGVRYDKGCFTGQETVARLHFRGHPNRALRGIAWAAGDEPVTDEVTIDGKAVGTIRTLAHLGDQWMGLAVLRREVVVGDQVVTGATNGVVIELPMSTGRPQGA